jgi:hypothetical protein
MVQAIYRKNHFIEWGITLFVIGIVLTNPRFVYGHGGKTHTETPFSKFEAVQKAMELYDRLITSGKLSEEWETTLTTIHVSERNSDNSRDTVVQFKLSNGTSDSVYFYFNQEGEYSGSNFTGE